eukprot:1186955-Prorocentrum_minimum.AAC.3
MANATYIIKRHKSIGPHISATLGAVPLGAVRGSLSCAAMSCAATTQMAKSTLSSLPPNRFSSAEAAATATVPHALLEHGFGDAACATFIIRHVFRRSSCDTFTK